MNIQNNKSSVRPVRIAGTGSAAPGNVMTNADLERMVDTSDEWITTRTGIKERRIAPPEMAASDIALPATMMALEDAGIEPKDLDAIICATVTPDQLFPSTACALQAKIGAPQAFAFDAGAACSGFLYAVGIAQAMIASCQVDRILVVGTEVLSRVTNWKDRTTCTLMGDGAGAVVLAPGDDNHRILSMMLGADGNHGTLIEQPAGGSRMPATEETVKNQMHTIHMKGNEVFKLAVRGMADACTRVLRDAGYTPDDVALLVTHQANYRIIEATARRLEIPMDRVFTNIQKYGNTSAASVPLALDEACRSGRLKEGDLLAMVVFGGGLTWGATLVRW